MSKIVFLFVCVAALQAASALECYSCKGAECDKDMKTWEKRQCGSSGSSLPKGNGYGCLKLNYKDRASQQTMVSRQCVITEIRDGKPMFNSCPNTDGEAINCPVCLTELCNSASSVSFSVLAFSGVVLALLAPKFL